MRRQAAAVGKNEGHFMTYAGAMVAQIARQRQGCIATQANFDYTSSAEHPE